MRVRPTHIIIVVMPVALVDVSVADPPETVIIVVVVATAIVHPGQPEASVQPTKSHCGAEEESVSGGGMLKGVRQHMA